MSQESDIPSSTLRAFQTLIYLLFIKIIISAIQTVMAHQVPAAPPPSLTLSSHSEAVSIINYSTEERDAQTYKDLCNSRIDLLEKQYHILKDTLHKAMGVADMWWGNDDVNNLEQQAKVGTKLIDEIIQPYFVKTQALVNRHQDRFNIDETICAYLDLCAQSVSNCFSPAQGMDHHQAYTAKGRTVRLAEVAEIRKFLSDLRKDYGRTILLEKGVRDYGLEHILKEPEEEPGFITWSLLWAGLTKPDDVKLWSIVPREDLQMHKRNAFENIKDQRISLLEDKIDTAEDFWDSKLELAHEEDSHLEDENDEEWAELFETSFVNHFEGSVQNTKLRLMKEYNIFNFRFLGPLTDEVRFDEDLHLGTLRNMEKEDWPAFVQYRMQLLQVEKGRAESLQFVPMDDGDE
jgi:hypothetical protein